VEEDDGDLSGGLLDVVVVVGWTWRTVVDKDRQQANKDSWTRLPAERD
jgi:hypothetical protein